jgi:asparaginyl-tRNA synthetase
MLLFRRVLQIEPEIAFADLIDDMDNAESFVKHVVSHVLKNCEPDLQFFAGFYDKQLFERLNRLVDQPFARYMLLNTVYMMCCVFVRLASSRSITCSMYY